MSQIIYTTVFHGDVTVDYIMLFAISTVTTQRRQLINRPAGLLLFLHSLWQRRADRQIPGPPRA